jgi:membrane protein YdbS with pleckstrin-like domain
MAADEPGADNERQWRDRDTEPIPRARSDDRDDAADRDLRDDTPTAETPLASARSRPSPGPSVGRARPQSPPTEGGAGYPPESGAGYPPEGGASYSVPVDEPLTEEELTGLRGGMGAQLVPSRRVLPLEDEASSLVQRYLFPTEKFRGEWRRHPIQLAKEIGIAAGATIVMGLLTGFLTRNNVDGLSTLFILGWVAVMVWVAWQIADWWFDRFILTNKRVMVVSGIITRNVAMMPLLRVTDMKYVQSPLGRILNYGTFELESAGQDQALRKITNLPNPNELYLRIVEEMYEPEAVEARLAGASTENPMDDGT